MKPPVICMCIVFLVIVVGALKVRYPTSMPTVGETTIGCTPAGKQEAKTVLDDTLTVAQYLCVIAKLTPATDIPALMVACDIDAQLGPAVQKVVDGELSARRAYGCPPSPSK